MNYFNRNMPTDANARLCLRPSTSTKSWAPGKPQVKVPNLIALLVQPTKKHKSKPLLNRHHKTGVKESVSKGVTH